MVFFIFDNFFFKCENSSGTLEKCVYDKKWTKYILIAMMKTMFIHSRQCFYLNFELYMLINALSIFESQNVRLSLQNLKNYQNEFKLAQLLYTKAKMGPSNFQV